MTVLLKLVFSCSNSLLSFLAVKGTTGTYNFVSFILKVPFVGLLIPSIAGLASESASHIALLLITQFSDQVNGISNVLQKLLKCFNGTTILTLSFSALPSSNFPLILFYNQKTLNL